MQKHDCKIIITKNSIYRKHTLCVLSAVNRMCNVISLQAMPLPVFLAFWLHQSVVGMTACPYHLRYCQRLSCVKRKTARARALLAGTQPMHVPCYRVTFAFLFIPAMCTYMCCLYLHLNKINYSCHIEVHCHVHYYTHVRAITDIIDHGKVGLPEQQLRAQPETVRG